MGLLPIWPWAPVLIKVGLGVHLGPSCMHPGPAEAATNCGSLVAPNRLPSASNRQHLTLAYNRVPSRRPQTNIPSGHFQTTTEQDPINFKSSMSKERFWQAPNTAEVNSTLCSQPCTAAHMPRLGLSLKAVSLRINSMHTWVNSNQDSIQQEGLHNSQKGHSWNTQFR